MYIAGVDGGGSKTQVIVTDVEGNVKGSGFAGCGNHQMIGAVAAVSNMKEALQQAMTQANINLEQLSFIEYGLAGADRAQDFAILRPEIEKQIPASRWDVVCDTMEGLRVGSSSNTGVVLVCGSNTNAAGRNHQGMTVQIGGFDELFGDRAGGFYLSKQAFGRAIRSWDGREPYSLLVDRIPQSLGYRDMEELIHKSLDADISTAPLEIAIIVHEVAKEGDWLAIQLLQDMGRELGLSTAAVIRKLGGFENKKINIVLTGSILQRGKSNVLLEALECEIKAVCNDYELITPTMSPVYGAIMLAMDHLEIEVTEDIRKQLEKDGGY